MPSPAQRGKLMAARGVGILGVAVLLLVGSILMAGCGGGASNRREGPAPVVSAPSGFVVGAQFDGPALSDRVGLDRQMSLAARSGVRSLRVSADWAAMQPYRGFSDAPSLGRAHLTNVGGVPTDFSGLDRVAAAASRHGLSLLPVVLFTPGWASEGGGVGAPPRDPGQYAAFLRGLVMRYGPHGSFWGAHPSLSPDPVRAWQIWNEPDFPRYWSVQPFAASYVKLLAAAHAAVKAADPGAQVVLAGLPEFSWRYLAQIYAVPGARALFDVVAVHPYTATPAGVMTILGRVRAVMNRSGDRHKPILASEITWPSSEGRTPPQFGVGVSEPVQARLISELMPLLARDRARLELSGFYWYTWMGQETPGRAPYGFDYAGLLAYVGGKVLVKSALAAFRSGALRLTHSH